MVQRRFGLESGLSIATVAVAVLHMCILGRVFECLSSPFGSVAWPLVLLGPIAALTSIVFTLAWRTSRVFSPLRQVLWTLAVCIAVVGWPVAYISTTFFVRLRAVR